MQKLHLSPCADSRSRLFFSTLGLERNARRWFAQATKRALAIEEYGQPSPAHLDPATLRQALGDNLEQTIATFRKCSEVSKAWADAMERAPTPTLMFDDAPGDPTQTKH